MAKIGFTAGRVAAFKCPVGKSQAFLWDSTANGLGLRVTPVGKPSFVFQSEFQSKTIRVTIGSPVAWSVSDAQNKARELQRQIDEGRDPRVVKAAMTKADAAIRQTTKQQAVTVAEAWGDYVSQRKPHWGERHYQDHLTKAASGGRVQARGTSGRGTTIAGPLHALMHLPLRDLNAATIEAWAAKEGAARPTSARLAWRLLKVFLGWCAEQPGYTQAVPDKNPAKTKRAREAFGPAGVKSDVLQREQLKGWFAAVQGVGNPVIAAYLQVLLLTGGRPGEVMGLRWVDVNLQWRGMTIRDKVDGERVIPLTPYVRHLVVSLPKRNEWVFSSPTSASGHLTEPTGIHTNASKVAGIDALTLHGLRRSFKSLTEWLEVPVGVVAQIQGHKPSATAEKHYTVRPLELLRLHHEKIEAWILEQAGLGFEGTTTQGALMLVVK